MFSKNHGNEAANIKAEFVLEINMAHLIVEKLKELFENDKDTVSVIQVCLDVGSYRYFWFV